MIKWLFILNIEKNSDAPGTLHSGVKAFQWLSLSLLKKKKSVAKWSDCTSHSLKSTLQIARYFCRSREQKRSTSSHALYFHSLVKDLPGFTANLNNFHVGGGAADGILPAPS